ncbi:VOC family protein [Paenibacillus monticola]|uniref:VOC family protein n=1 Tax=Paenibacillus monticola TaxID=2666075 RepID=A0A7X2H2G7_9BACL|nr:VOC family protein [Paenibacillus monticola]MRN51453.1 VOC family protein [Paenibacillus monticola]
MTQLVTQIGIIVNDIEKVSASYAKFFGIEQPKWFWTDTVDLAQTEFNPSTWRDFLDKEGEGVHHIAFSIKGMKEKIELLHTKNMPLIQKGEFTGGRYAYIDTFSELKVLTELLENDK